MEPVTATSNPLRSPWLVAFGVILVVHLGLVLADARPWDSITKCLIAPILVAWVLEQKGPRILALALVFCFFGDLFLELEPLFLLGMLSFAAAHICLITFFIRRGALRVLTQRPWLVALLDAVAIVMVVWIWPDLDAGLGVPVLIYALLLAFMAALALAADLRAGIGAVLFLISDGLIAVRLADKIPDTEAVGFLVMLTYGLALFLLTTAIVVKEARTRGAADFDPTKPTDCWPTLPEVTQR